MQTTLDQTIVRGHLYEEMCCFCCANFMIGERVCIVNPLFRPDRGDCGQLCGRYVNRGHEQ